VRLFLRSELVRFLTDVDHALRRRVEVVIIGGAAAAVQYGFDKGTNDIDTWTTVGRHLAAAVRRARQSTGLALPFHKSGVADGPFDLEGRFKRALPRLRRLRIMVPERHDLVLMKTVRGYEHDLEAIEAIHRRSPLELEVLLTRYQEEMGDVVISPLRLRGNLLTMIERLFPDELDDVARRLSTSRGQAGGRA
jgi:hypothetical protein